VRVTLVPCGPARVMTRTAQGEQLRFKTPCPLRFISTDTETQNTYAWRGEQTGVDRVR